MASLATTFMLIVVTCGALMKLYMKKVYTFSHGAQAVTKLLGLTLHDQLFIKTFDSINARLKIEPFLGFPFLK
ncbi:hypothetical protein PHAVU_008G126900 [Phaseolus vulgaris]|uniref:DUF7865 domain-containing protein n=1 Tax=Phaseolus vulgaris TaxID=3885 RepID=V7B6X9_PHAVU|nr:hypothetical protein PHAVU_008G126900g [Phaseolus vulgaris]ESW12608.1 hypothetical protein PHAVU_008G126900g [Phaseolus vulgaris]